MNSFGENLCLTVSGENRGPCVLMTLDGLPAGMELDMDAAWRRVSGADGRDEEAPAPVCGVRDGRTSGGPVSILLRVEEEPARPGLMPRPGHEDLAAMAKYGRGEQTGGAYSGRLTLALALAGELCAQLLELRGVYVEARVSAIGGAAGREDDFEMKRQLLDARGNGDSVGCVVECEARGLPAGLGSPAFGGLESRVAALLFSVPGVKGVEFGLGFRFAELRGSAANDQIALRGVEAAAETNNSGGVDVGISTGAPIIVRAALRPNPSVGREQKTADLETMREVTIRQRGRHEPSLGGKALPAVRGAVAFCLLDALLDPDVKGERWN